MLIMKDYDFKVSAAGRINIMGEHVDYCGGKVMPAAISLKNTVYARPNGTDKINISWSNLPDKVTLEINNLGNYKGLKYGNYQAGSAFVWQRAGHKLVGCDLHYDCSIPFGGGLSSSAATEVSTIAALATAAGEAFDNIDVALKARQAEREYVGVNCGIMDQYASACGKAGNAMLLDCKTLECEYVPVVLGDYAFVITNCKKPHNLVESKYNERRAQTEEALEILQKHSDIKCLADLSVSEFIKYSSTLPEVIRNRARHVVYECDRVRRAAAAMREGDMKTLGKLLNESHKSLADLYEVTGKELDALAYAAQSYPACAGSRMTGGGFGGCTISLVEKDGVEGFKKHVYEKYKEQTGYSAEFYDADISDGITVTRLN